MNETTIRRGPHLPKGRFGRNLLNLLITALVGFVFFYVSLPALNLHDPDFYGFLGLLCAVYLICVFLLSGAPHDGVVRTPERKYGTGSGLSSAAV